MLNIIITLVLIYLAFRYCATNSPDSPDQSQPLTEAASDGTAPSSSATPAHDASSGRQLAGSQDGLPSSPAAVQVTKPMASSQPSVPPIVVPGTTTFTPRHQILQSVESVNWCNDLTRICWPHIGKIVEAQLSVTLEPLINLYLPKPFSKFRFTKARLGKDPLHIDKIVVHRRFNDSIALDLDVTFRGHPDISMRCSPLSAPFGIKELRWSGRLAVILKPLLTHLPLIGAMQVAMIRTPDLQMDFTGVANLAEFGPIEKIVKMVLNNVISAMMVLPNRLGYVVSESIDYFSVYQDPVGVIKITIERGKDFTKERKAGMIKVTPDLYCVAQFGLESMKTNVQYNNLSPEWTTSKSFILSDLEQLLELSVYDKDAITRDDLGGSLTVTAKDLMRNETQWYPLTDDIDVKFAEHGKVYLSAQLWRFKDPREPVKGLCVFSILIDKAKGLPKGTTAAACKVTIGGKDNQVVRETPEIKRPKEPIPGIDPENPTWNFSFDILSDEYSASDILLEVVCGKHTLGSLTVDVKELEASESNVKQGEFSIGNDATLRTKIMLRGIIPGTLPPMP